MSYVTMDHAGWVEDAKRIKLTPFQARAMNILGIVGRGIYNAPIAWKRVEWDCGGGIAVPWRRDMSTYDFSELTTLVLLCHEARIRVTVAPHTFREIMIMMHQRKDCGRISECHPNIDEAVASLRGWLPKNHSIVYRAPAEIEAAS